MSKILILRNVVITRYLVFALSILLLVISFLFPITMFLLYPALGILSTLIYLYLIYKTLAKHSYFKGRIHSIDTVGNKLILVCSGFFKFKFKEHIYHEISDLVLTKHETVVPLAFRYFELSARIDGNELPLAKSLSRKKVNLITKDINRELNLCFSLNEADGSTLIDSNKYCFNNLDYDYSYSPITYLINGLICLGILPIGGIIPYVCLPLSILFFMNYFKSRQNLKEMNPIAPQ